MYIGIKYCTIVAGKPSILCRLSILQHPPLNANVYSSAHLLGPPSSPNPQASILSLGPQRGVACYTWSSLSGSLAHAKKKKKSSHVLQRHVGPKQKQKSTQKKSRRDRSNETSSHRGILNKNKKFLWPAD